MHFVSNLNCSFEIGEKFWTFFLSVKHWNYIFEEKIGLVLYFILNDAIVVANEEAIKGPNKNFVLLFYFQKRYNPTILTWTLVCSSDINLPYYWATYRNFYAQFVVSAEIPFII
jgi:hypothetical protein